MNIDKNIKTWKNEFFGNFTKVKFDEEGVFWQCLYKNPREQEEVTIECIGNEESPNTQIIDWLEQIIIKPKALHNHTSLYHHLEWLTKKYDYTYEQYYDWMIYYKITYIKIDEISEETIWCDVTFQYIEDPDFKITIECYNLIPCRAFIKGDIIPLQ